MINQRIMRKLLLVEDFPTLPEVMNQILNTIESEDSSAEELTAVIEQDHAISVRVLRMANSAFYGLRNPVATLRLAVVVLGFNQVRLLALATTVFDTMSKRPQFALDPTDFWLHSLGTAKAAQIMARNRGAMESVATCFTAGLIHDVGKYMLALALTDEYRAIVQEAEDAKCCLRQIELERIETTSFEVGAWLCEKWRLPTVLAKTIRTLPRAASYAGDGKEDVVTVALADQLALASGFGTAGDCDEPNPDPELAETVGLDPESIPILLDEMRGHLADTREFVQYLGRD